MCKISVIIAVYNMEKYLKECLESIINQTLKDIEIICVDDGSTDKSLEILQEFANKDSRIKIIVQENQKLGIARNNALNLAKKHYKNGLHYVLFCDADDKLRLDACENLYNNASKNDLDMLIFGGYNFLDGNDEKIQNDYWNFSWLPLLNNKKVFNFEDCRKFVYKIHVSSCLTMYKLDFIIDNNLSFVNLFFEDNLFFLKAIINAKRISTDTNQYYIRRIHSLSVTNNWDKHFDDYICIVDLILSYLKETDKKIYKIYRKIYLGGCISLFNNYTINTQEKYKNNLKNLLKKYKYKHKNGPTIIEKIFSIKNEILEQKKYKVIRLLGIKIKFQKNK